MTAHGITIDDKNQMRRKVGQNVSIISSFQELKESLARSTALEIDDIVLADSILAKTLPLARQIWDRVLEDTR